MTPLRVISVCSGIGGFELSLRQVFLTRVVQYVEWEKYAQKVLQARMRDGQLDEAPIHSDLRDFPAAAWRGKVDLLCGGPPCQPYSSAGKRRGAEDSRDLVDPFLCVLRDTCAPLVALENVARLVRARGGLERVLAGLAGLGFHAVWGVVNASDAGAPHRRARVFVLGWLPDAGSQLLREQQRWRGWQRRSGTALAGVAGQAARILADGHGNGQQGLGGGRLRDGDAALRHDADGRGGAELRVEDAHGQHGHGRAARQVRGQPGAAGAEDAVGHADQAGREGPDRAPARGKKRGQRRGALGHAGGQGREGREQGSPGETGSQVVDAHGGAGHGAHERERPGHVAPVAGAAGAGGAAHERWQLPQWPPGPQDRAAWERIAACRPDLLPAVPAVADTQPALRGVAHGLPTDLVRDKRGRIADRRAQLRCYGNAVCPPQAALAFDLLLKRAIRLEDGWL